MSTPARIQEQINALGFNAQADIATANVLADFQSLTKVNAALNGFKLNLDTDAPEMGKGHEFPTQTFMVNWDVAGQIEKYLSAEIAAWAMCFGLGHIVQTGSDPDYIYTVTPIEPAVDGLELPYFSFIESIRQGGSAVLDRMAVGCALNSFTITIGSGPGRANAKITANFAGSGLMTTPSGIDVPSPNLAETLLYSGTLALSINGTNYVTSKNIISLEFGWNNNLMLDTGFYPGSGYETSATPASGAIRGRLEIGVRQASLKFTARFVNGSPELAALLAQTSGTAVFTLSFDTHNSLEISFAEVTYSMADLGETGGLVTVAVECVPIFSTTLVTAVAKCLIAGIGQIPA